MEGEGGLKPFLQQLKKQGLSNDEIIAHLVRKGVDKKKAELVVDAYTGESESFSDLIQDIKIQKFTEEELAEIRKRLKSDLYHEESGLKMLGGKQQAPAVSIKQQTAAPAQASGTGLDLSKEALGEIAALKKELMEKNVKKSSNEALLESSRQELAQLKEENARLASEVKRLDGEVAGLREMMKELITAVREIRSVLT